MLTPQAIKDQEFQVKFRGYDSIEVKAYLELLAEDYFELTEQNRVLTEEVETLAKDKENLESELMEGQEDAEGARSEIEREKEDSSKEIEELKQKLKDAEENASTLGEKNKTYEEAIEELESMIAAAQEETTKEQAEVEKLNNKLEVLEMQNNELKQEGVDFKTTILAAQNFADSLREKSEKDAQQLMEDAKAEVEKYRAAAEEELARLPLEIEELERKKSQVRDDLLHVLQGYLDGLDAFPERKESDEEMPSQETGQPQ